MCVWLETLTLYHAFMGDCFPPVAKSMTPAHDPKPGEQGPLAHQGKYAKFKHFLDLSGPRKKTPGMAPNGPGKFFFLFFFRLIQTLPTF